MALLPLALWPDQKANNQLQLLWNSTGGMYYTSGGSRNLERGVQLWAQEAHPKVFGLPCPLPVINAFVTHTILVATDW